MAPEVAIEQPGIRRLLGELLERLEKRPARDRAPQQTLHADVMPEFGPNRRPGEADSAWAAIKVLAADGYLTIDPIKLKPGQADYEAGPKVRLVVDREEELRALAGIPRRGPGAQELWRQALSRSFGAADPRVERMVAFRLPFVEGRTLDELAGALKALSGASETLGTPLRTVSARHFWGLSKVLDGREDLVAILARAERCPFPSMRVHLPARVGADDFREILLIENQDTFDLVCRVTAEISPVPVVLCAHGFKASAARIRSREGCLPLYVHEGRSSEVGRQRFERWLFRGAEENVSVRFWGDLDWEGIRILNVLREAFPGTQSWEVGYYPMLLALQNGLGHEPASGKKDGQRPIKETGCRFADQMLIPTIERTKKFLDQEFVAETELRARLSAKD